MGYNAGYSMATMTQLLNKIRDLDIKNTGWMRLSSTAQEPVFLDNLLTPGNYSIAYWRQGPASVTSKIPINVSINKKNGIVYQTVFYMTTIFERVYDEPTSVWGGWAQLQSLTDSEFQGTEPLNPCDNMIWFDISNGKPEIRVFNAATGRWEYAQPDKMLRVSIYDPQGKATDYYTYVDDGIDDAGLHDAYTVFTQHISDETLHITAEEMEQWNGAQDDTAMQLSVDTTMNEVKSTIPGLVNAAGTKTGQLQTQVDTLIENFDAHVADTAIHPTHTKQNEWISKADGNHEHYLDSRVTITPNDITGVFSVQRFDAGAMERGITVETTVEMLALAAADIQNGDSVFNKENRFAYFVVDQTKLGNMTAFLQYSAYQAPFTWENVENKPTSVAGYGITDAYNTDDVETLIDGILDASNTLGINSQVLAEKLAAITTPADAAALATELSSGQTMTDSKMSNIDTLMRATGLTPPPPEFIVTKANRNLIGYSNALEEFTIPAEYMIDGELRTIILGTSSFSDSTNLKSITIEPGIKMLPDMVFSRCTALHDITIPDTVTTISAYALSGCTALEACNISDASSLSIIGIGAFQTCKKLSHINLPNSVNTIGNSAFYGSGITAITIPYGVSVIDVQAFRDCKSLASINIPATVTTIDSLAFCGCTALSSVNFSNESQLTTIGDGAFHSCSSLKSISLPPSVSEIERIAFYGCTSLTAIEIPYGITCIYDNTFHDCRSLISVVIPNTVTTIEGEAFYDCRKLPAITIPESVITIGGAYYSPIAQPFYGCSKLAFITVDPNNTHYFNDEYGVLYSYENELIAYPTRLSLSSYTIRPDTTVIGDHAFSNCNLQSIDIPYGITHIGQYAFGYSYYLQTINIPNSVILIDDGAFIYTPATSISIPASVTNIGVEAFGRMGSLTFITVDPNNTHYFNDEYGVLYSYDNSIIQCPKGLSLNEYNVRSDTLNINAYAFCESSIQLINVPNSVNTIGQYAFSSVPTVYYEGTAEGSPWGAGQVLPYPTN